MNRISLTTFLTFLLLVIFGSAVGDSPINYSESISFPGCEFQVHFPTKTQRKMAYANGNESLIVQSIYDSESPFMRAECIPLSDPKQTIAAFRSVLENQGKMAGISNPEITIEKTSLGMVGTYSGHRKTGGFDIKLFGKLIIGRQSLLSLLTSEEATKFPSDKLIYFLNTVDVK